MKKWIGLLLAVAVLVVLAVAWVADGEDSDAHAYPTTPFDVDTLEELHEIRDEISGIRGLSPNPDVEEGWVSSRDYAAHVEERFADIDEEALREVAIADTVLKLLGILGPGDSYYDQARDISANYIAGFYSFESDQLVLVGGRGRISAFDRSTLAHEYVHSFQESLTIENDWGERFGYGEDEVDLESMDTATLGCIIEGDAELAEAHFSGETRIESWDDYAGGMSWMERNFYFRYAICPLFVDAIYRQGGWEAVNALYAEPPESIEQVLHPEKYDTKEGPTDLESDDLAAGLGGSWEQLSDDVFNEFDVWNLVLEWTGDIDLADTAAEGWGMGRIGFYAPEGDADEVVGHIALQFDSRKDFGEFEVAMARALQWMDTTGRHQWANETGSGGAFWDRTNNRVDIVLATDDATLRRAAAALGYEAGEALTNVR